MTASSEPDVWSTPALFPHRLDAAFDRVVVVGRTEADFRAASFLDDRSLGAAQPVSVAWSELAGQVPTTARRDVQYILHIGHVGSTLVSRLLGEASAVLSLREPLILRGYADQLQRAGQPDCAWAPDEIPRRIDALTALLSRTFRKEQRALVKATSFVSEVAAMLVPHESRAVFLYVPPERYLATILAGEASRQEMHLLGASRVTRLNRRARSPLARLWELDEGERAALGWACEMTALVAAAARLPEGSVRWVDFDNFLASPAESLVQIADFLDIPLDVSHAQGLVAGELMQRYSKAPEHHYSPDLRRRVIAQAREQYRAAIHRGSAWIERAATSYPALAQALTMTETSN